MKALISVLLPALLFLMGCKTKKPIVVAEPIEVEERQLDTLTVSAPRPDHLKKDISYELPRYNETYHLTNDQLHTKLELKFDWAKQHVLGKATLTFTPYFYPTDQLELDAVNFDIHQITYANKAAPLKYDYDGEKLYINLGKVYKKGEQYTIVIDYTAKPADAPTGGSAAITSDQGLYFINHDGSDPNKPMQIWTQGETQANSRWFPTIDKPNERTTQEMYLTVEDKFETLSNGTLVSSEKNSNGTRTDYWKMDLPHAPYLFMIAIGEYAVVKDTWEGKPVDYYVEPKYKPYAREIYKNTVPMLTYFSDLLNYKYPWPKYSQVIVRDYVSGAMENTTGVIFGEFMQLTDRELIDHSMNELIVAHELFHHWFGDLVTCESWANLTMNEGFANYSEYLWFQHQYGDDRADHHRLNEFNGYVGSTRQGGIHPLIHFGYDDKEDMFDAHSYNKGGLVLHMLRNYLGDEAFFASLHRYLKDNEYTAVEAHNLRLAVEATTGQDMNWFFNQWFFSAGHPMLDISYDYTVNNGKVSVTIEQQQNPEKGHPAIFILPFTIDVYDTAGKATRHNVVLDKRKQSFYLPVDAQPALINVDADKILLAEINDNKSPEAFAFQYKHAPKFLDRYNALQALAQLEDAAYAHVFKAALKDNYWELRRIAINAADHSDPTILASLDHMAVHDPHSFVRADAITALAATEDKKYIATAKKLIDQDRAYRVISAGLNTLNLLDEATALSYAAKLEKETDGNLLVAVGKIYGAKPNVKYLDFFENSWDHVDGFQTIAFFENYSKSLAKADKARIKKALATLEQISLNMGASPWRRFAATKTMHELRESYRAELAGAEAAEKEALQEQVDHISTTIDKIKAQETNDQLKMIYNNF